MGRRLLIRRGAPRCDPDTPAIELDPGGCDLRVAPKAASPEVKTYLGHAASIWQLPYSHLGSGRDAEMAAQMSKFVGWEPKD